MKKEEYYNKQDSLTAAKIEFYQDYIEGYLIKLLMGFGKCFIADLFCGAGKNGNKQGSPLVLIDKAKYILKIPKLQNPQIYILFNDKNKNNIKNLEEELKNIEVDKNVILKIENDNFEDALLKILELFKNKDIPTFFFLDPFTYSDVKMKHLEKIMSLKFAEILLFSPIFHSYRFASDKKLKNDHKTRVFIEEFTDRGISNYKNVEDFRNSIKNKLKQELNLDFVRPILLNYGHRINSLFLLTKHEEGMLLMNNLCIKKSKDGSGINVKENYEDKKFLTDKKNILKLTLRYKDFKDSLIKQLQIKKEMTTNEIKKFTIMSEFRPQDASDVLKKLKKEGKIKFFDMNNKETEKFYMAIKPKGNSVFRYV